MGSIGIVGSGIAGLHLGLYLQQRGIPATIYSDRSSDEIRAGRPPNTVARFGRVRARERVLDVEHWLSPELEISSVQVTIGGPMPLSFSGETPQPWN